MHIEQPSFESERELEKHVQSLAQSFRNRLEKQAAEPEENTEALTRFARITLESYGRALLETGKGLDLALEFLDLSGALQDSEVQHQLLRHLNQLRDSQKEEDQRLLIEVSKRILS